MASTPDPRFSWNRPTPASFGTPEAAQQQNLSSDADARFSWSANAPVGEPGVSWATLRGQNMEGPHNAFDTTFWERHNQQNEESRTQPMGERWSRPDATGIVFYDDKKSGLVFGDVYLDGTKQGNIFEGYGGLSDAQAYEIAARSVLSREAWARAYESEAGRPLTLAGTVVEEVEKERRKLTEGFEKGLEAAAFEADINERAQGFEESAGAKTANVVAGAATGAAWGAGVASIIPIPGISTLAGAGLGALVGGLGAWLNRDAQFQNIASAMEQYDQAQDMGLSLLGESDFLANVSGTAMSYLNPTRNILHGLYEVATDGVGDSERLEQPKALAGVGFTAIDTAALVLDGIGTFGGTAARLAFTATMGTSASARTASVVAGTAHGTVAFNPYTGKYEDVGLLGMGLQAGAAGIDFFQTGAGAALTRGLAGGRNHLRQSGGFRIGTNEAGEEVTKGLGLSIFIPSEAATGMVARTQAKRSLLKTGEAITPAALARETAKRIDALTSGRRTIATMAVNGFGEGAEEFVQSALEALSFREVPTFSDLVDAARQGFGMGAGMGLATARSTRSLTEQHFHRANAIRGFRNQDPLEWDDFQEMTSTERALLGTAITKDEADFATRVVAEVRKLVGSEFTKSIPQYRAAMQAAIRQVEQDLVNSQPTADPARLSTLATAEYRPHQSAISLGALIRDVGKRLSMWEAVARGDEIHHKDGTLVEVSGERREYAERMIGAERALHTRLQAAQKAIDANKGNREFLKNELGKINNWLSWAWSVKEGTDERKGQHPDAWALRRVASFVDSRYPLNSQGSFQLMNRQVDWHLTETDNHQTQLMPIEAQPPTGGDFDGDMVNVMLRLLVNDEAYDNFRAGLGQMTGDGAMLKPQTFSVWAAENLRQLSASTKHAYSQVATTTKNRIKRRLHAILRTAIPQEDRVRIINKLVHDIASDNIEEGFSTFYGELTTHWASEIRDLALRFDIMPLLELNRAIEDELVAMGTRLALTDMDKVDPTGRVELPETSAAMPKNWSPQRVTATSDVAEAGLLTQSWNKFRLDTITKYNSWREALEVSPEELDEVLQGMIETFVMLNDGMAWSGRENLQQGVAVQTDTLSVLRTTLRNNPQLRAQLASDMNTNNENLVLLAGLRVPDMDFHPGAQKHDMASSGGSTFVQVAMKHALNTLRSRYGELMERDERLAQRFASLEAATRPTRSEGNKTHAVSGIAFVEVFGAFPATELLGDAGSNIAGFTARTLMWSMVELPRLQRQEFVRSLKRHPHYEQEAPNALGLTPYRVFVDNVIEAANMTLSETDQGQAQGLAAQPHLNARRDFKNLFSWLTRLVRQDHGTPTKASVQAYLESAPTDLADQVHAVLTQRGIAASVLIERGDNTGLRFPDWIYDVFAEKDPERAEMMLLQGHLLSQYGYLISQVDDPKIANKINDVVLRKLIELSAIANDREHPNRVWAEVARNDMLKILLNSETVDQWEQAMNTDPRFRPARGKPFMAWDRDVASLAADRYGKGVSSVLDGVELREALRDAAASAKREFLTTQELDTYRQDNAEAISSIASSKRRGETGRDTSWGKFVAWHELMKQLPALVSMAANIKMVSKVNELVGDSGDKGKSQEHVQAIQKGIVSQLPVFDSAPGRLLASMTSGSMSSILTEATQLARSDRTLVMNDGTVIDWDALTPEKTFELLQNEETAGFAMKMLGLSAWDIDPKTDVISLKSVLGEGVAGYVLDPDAMLFDGSQDAVFRNVMVADGMASGIGGTPFIPIHMATLMQWVEAGLDHKIDRKTDERQRIGVHLAEQIGRTLIAAATVEGLHAPGSAGWGISPLEGAEPHRLFTPVMDDPIDGSGSHLPGTGELLPSVLHRALLRAGRRARALSGSELERTLASMPKMHQKFTKELLVQLQHRLLAESDGSRQDLQWLMAQDLKTQLDNLGTYMGPHDLKIAMYQDFMNPLVQSVLIQRVESYGNLGNVVAGARDVVRAARRSPANEVNVLGQKIDIPVLTERQWHTLARAVISYELHMEHSHKTSSTVQIPLFPSLTDPKELQERKKDWDPSGVDAVADIFLPGIMTNPKAAPSPLVEAEIRLKDSMNPQAATVTEAQLENMFFRMMEPVQTDEDGKKHGQIGHWHSEMPMLLQASEGAVHASTAPSGVAMTGFAPSRMRFFAATTERTWGDMPPDEELSTVDIPASQLVTAMGSGQELDSMIEIEQAQNGQRVVRPNGRLIELTSKVAKNIFITAPDGSEIPVMTAKRFGVGIRLPRSVESELPRDTEAGVIVLDTLAESVSSILSDRNIPASEWDKYDVTVEFFHHATKPSSSTRPEGDGLSHSAWFDGLAGKTDAVYGQKSLMAYMFFELGGLIGDGYAHALDAMKKLHSAIQQITTMPESRRRELVEMGATDMQGMIEEFTIHALRTEIEGKPINRTYYNALRKFFELMYVVRYVDEDGVSQIMTSEQMIQAQQQGISIGTGVEVVGLPMEHLLTAMGETELSSNVLNVMEELDLYPDLVRAEPYTRLTTERMKKLYPGFLKLREDGTGWATARLEDQPELRGLSLPRVSNRYYEKQGTPSPRGFYEPWIRRQEQRYDERRQRRFFEDSAQEQKQRVSVLAESRKRGMDVHRLNGLIAEEAGMLLDAANLRSDNPPVTSRAANLTTAWYFTRVETAGSPAVTAVVTRAKDIEDYAALGDEIYLSADEFVLNEDEDIITTFPAARAVLDSIIATGSSVEIPSSVHAGELVHRMRRYMKDHGYSSEMGSSMMSPNPSDYTNQMQEAYRSHLQGTQVITTKNRVPLELNESIRDTEGALFSVNGGIKNIEDYFVSEVVQTGLYAGYAPPVSRDQTMKAVKILQRQLSTDLGREHLIKMSNGGKEPSKEERTRLEEALERLEARMKEILQNEGKTFLPTTIDEEFGTSDIIPLLSYNRDGEATGLHLYLHGHAPPENIEKLLRGIAPVEGQNLFDTDNVRLTIHSSKVDEDHTTRRGRVSGPIVWAGQQGFLVEMRVPLSEYGTKVEEIFAAQKWSTAPAPPDLWVQSRALFGGQQVLGAGDLASGEAKNADQHYLDNAGRIFGVVGFSTMPHLVRLIHGVNPDHADYHQYVNSVKEKLHAFARAQQGVLEPQSVVEINTDEFQDLMLKALQDRWQESTGSDIDLTSLGAHDEADLTMLILVLESIASGSQVELVTETPGLINNTQSHEMSNTFTTLVDQLPNTHPLRQAIADQINFRMRSTRENGDGYYISNDLHHWIKRGPQLDKNGNVVLDKSGKPVKLHERTMLNYPILRPTGDTATIAEMAEARRRRGSLSSTTMAMTYSTHGLPTMIDESRMKFASFFEENPYLHGSEKQILQQTFNDSGLPNVAVARESDDLPLTRAEWTAVHTRFRPARDALRVAFNTEGWWSDDKNEAREQKRKYHEQFDLAMNQLKLNKHESIYLIEMMRAVMVRPAKQDRDAPEVMTLADAMSALKLINSNASKRLWPTAGSGVAVITWDALQTLFRNGYQLKRRGTFKQVAHDWNAWEEVMLEELYTDDPFLRYYPAASNIIDGVMFEYRKDIPGLATTVNPKLRKLLETLQTTDGLMVTNHLLRARLDRPSVQEGRIIEDHTELNEDSVIIDDLPQSARQRVDQRMATWNSKTGMGNRKFGSVRKEAIQGATIKADNRRMNVIGRLMVLFNQLKTLSNPGLHASAYLEMGQSAGAESLVSLLAGDTKGFLGRKFTPEQQRLWRETRKFMALDPRFYQSVYENTNYKEQFADVTAVERKLQPILDFSAALMNDPTWGQSAGVMAEAYMSAAWDVISSAPDTEISVEDFLATLQGQSVDGISEISPEATRMGYTRIQYRRNLKDTMLTIGLSKFANRVTTTESAFGNLAGTILVKIPLLYIRFRLNTIIKMLGLQAPHAAISMIFSNRTKRAGGLKDYLTGENANVDPEASEQARLEDSVDLTRAIIRSGVSHTQLFALGMLVDAFGLAGDDDDEDERRREKLRRYQFTPVGNDPMSLESDFLNAHSWFSDIFPGGVGMPTWSLKLFASPVMGMARFFQTGDPRQIFWGFEDALGSLPLLNLDSAVNSWMVANELLTAAQAESMEESVDATDRAAALMLTMVGVLESMLFESAFLSMIYQASDELDRDPYAIPAREGGEILRDTRYNAPMKSTDLEDFIDPITGEARQGYVSRNDWDAQLRGLAEQRPLLAGVLALMKRDETYIRYNMVPKIRNIKSDEVTMDEAGRIIMAILNNETGQEELTLEGAEAVIRGIHLGTVKLDSPALSGVYISQEMRNKLRDSFLETATEKYMDLRFPPAKALSLAKEEFYGQAYGEPEAMGFADILYSDAIPKYPNQQYYQLNTGYMLGPNNRPIATGVRRSVVAALGIPWFHTYHTGSTSNLPVDPLLNSVDPVRGVNLGMRGLVKVDESWKPVTQESIGEAIEDAIAELAEKLDQPYDALGNFYNGYGYRGGSYYRRSSGGYSSGYGSSFSRNSYVPNYDGRAVNTVNVRRVRMPGSDDLYSINTSNPIIRRATVRRERFASQRGRLNQWQ